MACLLGTRTEELDHSSLPVGILPWRWCKSSVCIVLACYYDLGLIAFLLQSSTGCHSITWPGARAEGEGIHFINPIHLLNWYVIFGRLLCKSTSRKSATMYWSVWAIWDSPLRFHQQVPFTFGSILKLYRLRSTMAWSVPSLSLQSGLLRTITDMILSLQTFFEELLKEKTIVIPGIFFDINPSHRRNLFNSPCHHFVRLSFGPPLEDLDKGSYFLFDWFHC